MLHVFLLIKMLHVFLLINATRILADKCYMYLVCKIPVTKVKRAGIFFLIACPTSKSII